MNVPGIVQSRLDGEQVAAQVPLGGEDVLFVTRTRTLIYRADGLLSDESVEEYPHDAERIEISEGRRKSAVTLDYGIEGSEKFKVPSGRLYEALHPVLAGVLNAADVTAADETVKQTYQFSELTLVITSERVVKHVGAAVWDEDHEEYHFDDVTRLDVEEGSVSSQIIVESEGRPQRIKTPSDQTREVRERIERALLAYHDVGSYEAFVREHADAEPADRVERDSADDAEDGGATETADPLAGGVDPIDANPPELDDDGAIVEDDAEVATDARAADSTGGDTATGGNASTGGTASAGDSSSADASASTDAGADASANADADADTNERASQSSARGDSANARADSADARNDAGRDETVRTADAGDDGAGRAVESPNATDETESGGGFAGSGFEPASSELEADDTEQQLAALTEAVERQNELLAEQQRTLETLIDELRRGR